MLSKAVVSLGHGLAKRFADGDAPKWTMPGWVPLVALVDIVIILPIFLILGYTVGSVIPTLASVEDPSPPAYEPVALSDDAQVASESQTHVGQPITSSIRATGRLLKGIDGWRSYFRGIVAAIVLSVLTRMVGALFMGLPLFPVEDPFGNEMPLVPIAGLISHLALSQLSAGWTHIVISVPSPLPFYRRLPPFKKTFEATCFPILVLWVARSIAGGLTLVFAVVIGIDFKKRDADPSNPPPLDLEKSLKVLAVCLVATVLSLVTVVPSQVALTRVQASLLPPDEDTIVPFDRSFGGKMEPAVVGGKGYLTLKDAFTSFPRSSWVRYYKLWGKLLGLAFAVYTVIGAVIGAQTALIYRAGL